MEPLPVVRLAAHDAERAVQLLEQHNSRELVREGERAEREALVRAREHVRSKACRSAKNECDGASAGKTMLAEPHRELLARELLPAAIERDDVSA